MFNELNHLLDVSAVNNSNGDIGSGSLDGKHVLLSDFTKDDGAFLVHHFISHFLKAQQVSPSQQPPSCAPPAINVIVVSFAQSFNHFHCVAQKFGLNLRQLRESGSLVFVEALKELGDAIIHQGRGREADAEEEEQGNTFCSVLRDGDMSQLFRRLNFYMEDQEGTNRRPVVILDNVSVLLTIGVPLLKLVTFCNTLVASVCRQKGGTLVTHLILNDEDEQDRMLLKHLIYSCDCHLQVTPLSTGHSNDVHGEVCIWRETSLLQVYLLAKRGIMFCLLLISVVGPWPCWGTFS
ncbi:elongator complex protein 6 [Octopus bimaculoides]|uniref:elongator complex protein 6 n=1 Tax=Octopus bimaculoides TaxID=37653 RepID=UPI00071CE004|nr:elongator complex protein 6 [Octopus bimaculoides]|eukprot:XP_014783991.1 PREDICTED: elongator complex protein 6-like [Octopus bimaculoides]